DPQLLVLWRHRGAAADLCATAARHGIDLCLAPASRWARDGEAHDLGTGHSYAAAGCLEAGGRRALDLQVASLLWHDALPRLPVHAARPSLVGSGLLSRPAWP